MSLDKAIAHGKEHRKNNVYPNSYCRNHGGCFYCLKDRVYQQRKELAKAKDKLKEANVLK